MPQKKVVYHPPEHSQCHQYSTVSEDADVVKVSAAYAERGQDLAEESDYWGGPGRGDTSKPDTK